MKARGLRISVLVLGLLCITPRVGRAAPAIARVHLCGDRTLFLVQPRELWPAPEAGEAYRVTVFEAPEDVGTMVDAWTAGEEPVRRISEAPGEWIEHGTQIRAALPQPGRGGHDNH